MLGCGGNGMEGTKEFRMGEARRLKKIIFEKTGILIKDKCLLHRIFKKGSQLPEKNMHNHENLEFVGASILDFYADKFIEERYDCIITDRDIRFNAECKHDSKRKLNGILSVKHQMISNTNLSSIIDEWSLDGYITKEKADVFKSLLGAIAIYTKWNQEVLKDVVTKMLNMETYFQRIDTSLESPKNCTLGNAVSTLEELLKQRKESLPVYNCNDSEIYESDGMRWFCSCVVSAWGISIGAYAKDRDSAKKYAAYVVLCKQFGLVNEFEPNVDGTLYKLKY